jgi:hypothetical protein
MILSFPPSSIYSTLHAHGIWLLCQHDPDTHATLTPQLGVLRINTSGNRLNQATQHRTASRAIDINELPGQHTRVCVTTARRAKPVWRGGKLGVGLG